jgi:hypothetical protein
MSYEIINTLRGPSIIRCVDPGTYTINLTDLRKNPTNEVVKSADIKRVTWSSNGHITVTRAANTSLLALHNAGEMRFDDFAYAVSNTNTSNVVVTIVTGGTIVLELSKNSTYNVDVYTGQSIS